MANPQLSIRIAANLDDLRRSITEGKNIIGEVTPAVEKLAKTWTTNSQKMVQDAVNVTSAMAGMKGGTELTARDAAAALKKLEDGMAQLRKQGLPISPLMQQTADTLKASGAQAAGAAAQTIGLGAAMKSLAASIGLVMSVSALVGFIKNTIAAGSAIDDASKKLGVSAEQFQRWKYAATLSGATIDDVSTAVQFMNKTLDGGSASAVNALKRAGLEFHAIRSMSPEQAFNTIATAIMRIPDPMTRARVATELFGRGAATLLPAISADIVKVGNATEVMSDKMVADLDKADDTFTALGHSIEIWAAKAITDILHPIDGLKAWANPFKGATQLLDDVTAQVVKMAAALPTAVGVYAQLPPTVRDANDALAEADRILGPHEAAMKKAWAAADQYRKGVSDLADIYTGRALAKEIQKTTDAVTAAGGASKLTAFESSELSKRLNVMIAQGGILPPALLRIVDAHRTLANVVPITTTGYQGLLAALAKMPPVTLATVTSTDALVPPLLKVRTGLAGLDGLLAATSVQLGGMPPKVDTLADTLDDLSKAFAQMAQIGGDSFGGIAKGAGLVVSSLSAGVKAAEGVQKAFDAIDLAGGKGWSAQNIASLGTSVLGLVGVMFQAAKAVDMLSDAIGEDNKWKITKLSMEDFNSELQLSQRTIEALLPIWARMSALRLAQGLSSDMARANAEALVLTQIIQDLGGVSNLTSDQVAIVFDRVNNLLTMAAGQGEFARDAMVELDAVFKEMVASGTDAVGLISKAMVDLIKQEEELGVTTASVEAYRLAQITSAEAGVATALGVSSAAYTAQQAAVVKLADLNTQLAATTDQAQRAVIIKAIEATNAELLVQQGILSATSITSQQEAAAVAGAEIAAIDAKVKAGSTWIAAILSQQTSIQALAAELTRAGISGGAAFDLITGQLALATHAIAGPALTAMNGYTQAIVGLNNSGMLTADMFAGLANRISVTEQTLAAQGFTGAQIMGAMQHDLQVAWQLQQQYGYAVDASTQALINEAVEQGVVGATHMSTTDQMLLLTQRMTVAIEKLAGIVSVDAGGAFQHMGNQAASAFNGTIAGAQNAATQIKSKLGNLSFTVPVTYAYGPNSGPSAPASGAAMGGLVTTSGVQYLAGGGFLPKGTDTVPAMLTPGEGIVTRSGMSRLGVDGLRALNHGQPALSTERLEREIRDMRRDFPRAVGIAVSDALVLLRRAA